MEDIEDYGFDEYVVTTIEPGPMFMPGVVMISVSFFVLMVFAVTCFPSKSAKERHYQTEEQFLLEVAPNAGKLGRNSNAYGMTTTTDQSKFGAAEVKRRRSSDKVVLNAKFHRIIGHIGHDPILGLPPTRMSTQRSSVTVNDYLEDDYSERSLEETDFNVEKFCDSSTSTWTKFQLVLCHNCDSTSQSVLKLSGPFLSQSILAVASEILQLALVGHKLGTPALSAYVITDLLVQLTADFMGSVIAAGTTMISQVSDDDDDDGSACDGECTVNSFKAGRYLLLSMILYTFGSIPTVILWSTCMDQVLMHLGYDNSTAETGRLFVVPYSVAVMIKGLSQATQNMLDVVGYEVQSTFLIGFGEIGTTAIVAVFLCWKSLFPNVTLVGLGVLFLICEVSYLFILWLVICHNHWLTEYMDGFSPFANRNQDPNAQKFSNRAAVALMVKNASSVAFAMLVWHGEWQILIFFAGFLGPAEVATWGLLGTIWDMVEMIISAIAEACEVRCAGFLGSGRFEMAKFLAYKSLWYGTVSAGMLSLLLFALRNELPMWLTKDAQLQVLFSDAIPIMCLAIFASGVAIISDTLLYAQNRFALSTAITSTVSIGVTLPLAALSSILYKYSLKGQIGAIAIGVSLTGALSTFVLLRSDWKNVSEAVVACHDHGAGDSETTDNNNTATL